MSRITVTVDPEHRKIADDLQEAENLDSRSAAVRECITAYPRIRTLESAVSERDARIEGLESDVNTRDERISELESRVSERDARIGELESAVSEQADRLDAVDAEIQSRENRIEELKEKLMATNNRIDASNELVREVREERTLAERQEQRSNANVFRRAWWWVAGTPAEGSDRDSTSSDTTDLE